MIDASGSTPEEAAGCELRRLRVASGWSQDAVAARMADYGYCWHQTMVAKIEAAERPLRLNELSDLCDLFGVSVAAFLLAVPAMGDEALSELPGVRAARAEGQLARIREVLGGG